MRLAFLGAGAWGTALAMAAARRHEVLLWARDAAQAAQMAAERCNTRYLPGLPWPDSLAVTADFDAAVAHGAQGLTIVATPMAGLRSTLARLPAQARVIWLCKGFEAGTGLLGHEVAAAVLPQAAAGVLSGPSFAQEVAAGLPTALVAASFEPSLTQQVVDAFHHGALRIYTSADPVGVEIGGAVKNVLAIATGISDGLGLGLNARAALVTRGLAEMTRLGTRMGAQAETFMGLTGLGDLVLTATGDLSRNRKLGLLLAQGESTEQGLSHLGHVAEGAYSLGTVIERSRALQVDMPVAEAVYAVVSGAATARVAVEQLLQRDPRAEA
ncbi:NAD(P)H-dependent glycerol-3-phosphate dehydrogenase [Ideonella sp.]|uniref:NAD(P)H-dependent glycerol-3-phosphate dehydrogenase n=1 Tax=Ideonella sp. TaxID=1929293 RepID=UPI0035B428E5